MAPVMSVKLSNVTYAYPSDPENVVLQIPKWQITKGDSVFIHGPSGCGKTTLLNLLSGIMVPSTGSIDILDVSINTLSTLQRDRFRANNIGYVFQQFNLIPYLSAVENIQLAQIFRQKKQKKNRGNIENLLSKMNVADSQWYKPVSHLSVGLQQRIAIARALVNQPDVIIADEPTSSLDTQNRDDFMQLLLSQIKQQQKTLIFVSHDLSLSDYFNRKISFYDMTV